jgi:hypothetical protein
MRKDEMSKFKPLSIGSLPRVFVNLLAMDGDDIAIFAEAVAASEEMKTWLAATRTDKVRTMARNDDSAEMVELFIRTDLAVFFCAVLNLSKVSRSFFVKDFTRLLNELGDQDFWGTEGQCDPRGDRRDDLKYDR